MDDFIRARSEEQKEKCMGDIKSAAERLFAEVPYTDINLSRIASELGCSRTKVYQYASTKEEVFMEICADKLDAYFSGLMAAFPEGCGYTDDVVAEVWAGILNAHRDFLRYCDLLFTIIERNVTVERLAEFKRKYYEGLEAVLGALSSSLSITRDEAETLFYDVYYHALGLNGYIDFNPLVDEALEKIGVHVERPDFRTDLRRFIGMCLMNIRNGQTVN